MASSKTPLINQLMQRADIQSNTKDNSWDYLQELSDSWRHSLADINSSVARAFHFLDSCNAYKGEARVLVEGLQAELYTHTNKWLSLSNSHKGRTGLGRGPEEHSLILNTGLDYIQSQQEFMNACSFSAPRLQELVTQEEYRLRAYVNSVENQNVAQQQPAVLEALPLNTNI